MKRVVFTGGHHTSALVVARLLKDKGWEVHWFGHRHSMWGDKADSAEYKEVTAAGIKFYNLLAGKFYKTYNPLKLIRIPWGLIQAMWLLSTIRPTGIVSFGGYLAVPTVIGGWILRIPTITHEQTVTSGWANRVIAGFCAKIAVTWPESLKIFDPSKTVFVGLPLRNEIKALRNRLKVKANFGRQTIFITGGKQGSHMLNELVFANIGLLCDKYKVIHQTGTSTLHNDFFRAKRIRHPKYQAFDFDNKKWLTALRLSDVVISRAGAHTIYELGYLGKKCVLIPISWSSHNEQYYNAKVLESAGAGIILEEKDLSYETLVSSIELASNLNPKGINLPTTAEKAMIQLIEQEFIKL